jgi:hypothetical protein
MSCAMGGSIRPILSSGVPEAAPSYPDRIVRGRAKSPKRPIVACASAQPHAWSQPAPRGSGVTAISPLPSAISGGSVSELPADGWKPVKQP